MEHKGQLEPGYYLNTINAHLAQLNYIRWQHSTLVKTKIFYTCYEMLFQYQWFGNSNQYTIWLPQLSYNVSYFLICHLCKCILIYLTTVCVNLKLKIKELIISLSFSPCIMKFGIFFYHTLIESAHKITINLVSATSQASDQPAHTRSLIRAFASRLSILWLLSYWLNTIWSV